MDIGVSGVKCISCGRMSEIGDMMVRNSVYDNQWHCIKCHLKKINESKEEQEKDATVLVEACKRDMERKESSNLYRTVLTHGDRTHHDVEVCFDVGNDLVLSWGNGLTLYLTPKQTTELLKFLQGVRE